MAFLPAVAFVARQQGKSIGDVFSGKQNYSEICTDFCNAPVFRNSDVKKMHNFARLTETKDAKLENEAKCKEEPNAKKSRSANRISTITLDNGTMVEAFKYLNYCQLAKNSLVSKRFLGVIRNHRHKLALLYVKCIRMERRSRWNLEPAVIKIFNKKLSSAEYNEWVLRNNYSKQTSHKVSTAGDLPDYELSASVDYKNPNLFRTSIFLASVKEHNSESWLLFQHFRRLLMDPCINIRYLDLISQTVVFDLLAAAITPDRGRLQCEILLLKFEGNLQTSLNWIKDRVRCVSFQQSIPVSNCSANRHKQLFDFFAAGAHCTSEIVVIDSNISKAIIIYFVQKFMDLKNCDESHIVNSIRGKLFHLSAEALKTIYEQFVIKKEKNPSTTAHVFEFVNVVIRKIFQLTITNMPHREPCPVIINIMNL